MSTGLKRNWMNGDTWRNVAYLYYRNSLQYKYLLALNPSFDIRYIPAPDVAINATGQVYKGLDQPEAIGPIQGSQGQLATVDIAIDLRNTTGKPGNFPKNGVETIYPFSSYAAYADTLGGYTAAGLLDADRINGMMTDSPQASIDPIGSYDPTRRLRDAAVNRAKLAGDPVGPNISFETTQQVTAAVAAPGSSGVTVNNVTYTSVSSY
jgi:hypothetical protein